MVIGQNWRIKLRPVESIEPHSGVGGWMPKPRKLNVAADRMALPTPSVACTSSGANAFGRICRMMMNS